MNESQEPLTTTITVDFKKNRIRIFKSTIHRLGDPKYIQLLVNPTHQEFGIRFLEQDFKDAQTHKVNLKSLHGEGSYELYSRSFVLKLHELLGDVDTSFSYRLTGKVIVSKQTALFHISTLTRIDN